MSNLPDLTGTPVSFVVAPVFLDRIASDIANRLEEYPELQAAIQLVAEQTTEAVNSGSIETAGEALARFKRVTAENMRFLYERDREIRLLAIRLIHESVR